jgi:hypothetical protein
MVCRIAGWTTLISLRAHLLRWRRVFIAKLRTQKSRGPNKLHSQPALSSDQPVADRTQPVFRSGSLLAFQAADAKRKVRWFGLRVGLRYVLDACDVAFGVTVDDR